MGAVLPEKACLMGVFHKFSPPHFWEKNLLNLLTSISSVLHVPLLPSPRAYSDMLLTSQSFCLKSQTAEPTSHSLGLVASHSFWLIQPLRGSSSHTGPFSWSA